MLQWMLDNDYSLDDLIADMEDSQAQSGDFLEGYTTPISEYFAEWEAIFWGDMEQDDEFIAAAMESLAEEDLEEGEDELKLLPANVDLEPKSESEIEVSSKDKNMEAERE